MHGNCEQEPNDFNDALWIAILTVIVAGQIAFAILIGMGRI